MTKTKETTKQTDPNDPFDKADAKGKLELLLPFIKTVLPTILSQDAKASDNAIENLKLSHTIETKIKKNKEFLKNPQIYSADNKRSIEIIEKLNNQIVTAIIKEHEPAIKQYEKDTDAKLAKLLEDVKGNFPNTFSKDIKASYNINGNLKICQEIKNKFIKLNITADKSTEQKLLHFANANTEINNAYKLLKDVDLHKKDQSMQAKTIEQLITTHKTDTDAKLAGLIVSTNNAIHQNVSAKEYDKVSIKAEASDNIKDNLETCKKIEKQLNKFHKKSEDISSLKEENKKLMNEYKILLTIELQKGKDQSIKEAKSLGKKIKSAPRKAINKVTKFVSTIRGKQ